MTLLAQDTAEVVGSAAGFHCHYAGRQRSGKTDDALPSEASPQDDGTRSVQPCDAAAVLAKINPTQSPSSGWSMTSFCASVARAWQSSFALLSGSLVVSQIFLRFHHPGSCPARKQFGNALQKRSAHCEPWFGMSTARASVTARP